MHFPLILPLVTFCLASWSTLLVSTIEEKPTAENSDATGEKETLLEGHSSHGEVFNEGPRQAAYLMKGVGKVDFDVTTSSEESRAFFLQGVAQLHGFWYFESERSFRQASMIDPDCAMNYWGMAMSNRENLERAQGFIDEAMQRKDSASKRERQYIQAFHRWAKAKAESKEDKEKRARKYMEDLDDIASDFPEDLEAKAFLAEFIWSARRAGLKIGSYVAVDSMIQDVLDKHPMHPVHHYRIHLWDTKTPEKAIHSAALCGPSAPTIAHMWHMPGHIYSRLKRYHDAVYQQEASARIDHAHMMKDGVMPDQIHNFAHNNEWCIRNLTHIGRVSAALDLAKNMISLPRHPKYNTIDERGSFKYGRQRLQSVCRAYQLHDVLIDNRNLLAETGDKTEDLQVKQYLAAAYVMTGNADEAKRLRNEIQSELDQEKQDQTKAVEEAKAKAKEDEKDEDEIKKAGKSASDKFKKHIKALEKALQEIDARQAAMEERYEEALELAKKAEKIPVEEQLRWMVAAGQRDAAIKKAAQHVKDNPNEVPPLVAQIETLIAVEENEQAAKVFEALKPLSAQLDFSIPILAQLQSFAATVGVQDWQSPAVLADDIGERPNLDSLGPFRWSPQRAPEFALPDVSTQNVSLSNYAGQPTIVIFYLGAGCLHCAQQLQKFHPVTADFEKAGIKIVAVSTDKQDVLDRAYQNLEEPFAFPLLSDADLNIFKKYRCYDDFEKLPLHGTFLIDGDGRIRWQDISYEPFMEPEFLLKEAKRLLMQEVAFQ